MSNYRFNESLISFALFMVPIYTFFFAFKESPLDYTFSMIGNWFDYRLSFIIWGVVTATLLLISIIHIYNNSRFEHERAHRSVKLSMFFLILTVVTPTANNNPLFGALIESLPFFNLHGIFGFMFGLFLLLSLYLFSRYLTETDKEVSIKSIRLLLFTVGGSVATLFIFGMTGVFELFFFLFLSLFLLITNWTVRRNRDTF